VLHEMLLYRTTVMHSHPVFLIVWASDNSRWTDPEYVSIDKLLNQKYHKSYYISSRKQHQNRRNCHQTDRYRRWLCVGLRWGHVLL